MPSMPNTKQEEKDEPVLGVPVKSEENDVVMDLDDSHPGVATPKPTELPPQILVLVLESGDTVFLYLHSPEGVLRFEVQPFRSPLSQLVRPGFHMTADPSSRYLALGSAQKSFVVYELESLKSRDSFLNPVVTYRVRSVQGVIHKMQFLYPRPGDDHHIILLLIIIRHGRSRMVTYEWELGDSLRDVFAEEKRGHPMPVENQMPIMLIPLTVCSAFIAISEEQIAVCTDTLHGSPKFESVTIGEERPPTDNFHGRGEPLWVAWARPFRLHEYFTTNDCIYLAREDGVVYFVDADSESTVNGSLYIDKVDCNISAAFSCLYDQYDDVLVMGSDSSAGAIWKVSGIFLPVDVLCFVDILFSRCLLDTRPSSWGPSQTGLPSSTLPQPTSSQRGTRRQMVRGPVWSHGRTRKCRSPIASSPHLEREPRAPLPNTVTGSRPGSD